MAREYVCESLILDLLRSRVPQLVDAVSTLPYIPRNVKPLANSVDGRNWTVRWWLRSRPVPVMVEAVILEAADELANSYNIDWWAVQDR